MLAGTPDAAVPSLRALLDSGRHDVVAVLTRPDAPAGRGRHPRRSPVARLADEHGLPVLSPSTLRDDAATDALARLAPDCVAVVAYGALVPPALLDLPAHGWVNLHFSLLPAWRGAAPVAHAILAGDEITGATTFRLAEGLDTGPVLGSLTEVIGPRDTAGELLERLARSGSRLLTATLDGLQDGRLVAVAQPDDGVSLAPKLTTHDAEVDWTAPALRVDRLVRAHAPSPGAWTSWRGQRLKLGPVEPTVAAEPLGPGELRLHTGQVLAGTGSGPVRLTTVRPAGRPDMVALDWWRGARAEPGERFG